MQMDLRVQGLNESHSGLLYEPHKIIASVNGTLCLHAVEAAAHGKGTDDAVRWRVVPVAVLTITAERGSTPAAKVAALEATRGRRRTRPRWHRAGFA